MQIDQTAENLGCNFLNNLVFNQLPVVKNSQLVVCITDIYDQIMHPHKAINL
jgi:hypothetical protein